MIPTLWNKKPGLIAVVLIGFLSAGLYLTTYYAQGAIFFNGLALRLGGQLTQFAPASGPLLRAQLAAYYAATVALFLLYISILVLCRRGRLRDPRARNLTLLFPVLFNVGLLVGRPYLSIDLFSYLAHGYLGKLPGTNPYLQPAAEVGATSFGQQLIASGWRPVHPPSPYGPVWTWFEIFTVRLTENVPAGMWMLKTLVVAASLGSAVLIWKILGRVRPEDQLFGTLVYLWNPMIVVELAGEGHNDALMVFFVLAALAAAVYARPTASVVAMSLGVLTKYLPVIFFPAQMMYLWRNRPSGRSSGNGRSFALYLLPGAVFGLVIAAGLYAPLWAGLETFQAWRGAGALLAVYSPRGVVFGFLAFFTSYPETTARITTLIAGTIFLVYLLVVSWRVRDAVGLLRACAGVALIYLLVASPGYWPWYATLPLALIALSPRGILLWMALIVTFCSRLVAPLAVTAINGFIPWAAMLRIMTGVGVTLPLFILLLLVSWRILREDAPPGKKRGGVRAS